jgi:DNA-binding response OmpR family regulator
VRVPTDRIAASPVVIHDEPLKAVPGLLVFDGGTGLGWAVGVLLRSENFAVEQSATPGELVEMTASRRPAAIILAMSDVTGTEALCRKLRSASADAFIVVISPMVGEIVLGPLEAGADDFVMFPAMASELVTRIRAGLRRARASREPDHRHGGQPGALEILLDEHRVRVGNRTFELTRTEFRLLAELASAPGRVFTRDVLLTAVWGYEYIGNGRLVDSHIWRLRRKLDAIARSHIATVRGYGYKFVP